MLPLQKTTGVVPGFNQPARWHCGRLDSWLNYQRYCEST